MSRWLYVLVVLFPLLQSPTPVRKCAKAHTPQPCETECENAKSKRQCWELYGRPMVGEKIYCGTKTKGKKNYKNKCAHAVNRPTITEARSEFTNKECKQLTRIDEVGDSFYAGWGEGCMVEGRTQDLARCPNGRPERVPLTADGSHFKNDVWYGGAGYYSRYCGRATTVAAHLSYENDYDSDDEEENQGSYAFHGRGFGRAYDGAAYPKGGAVSDSYNPLGFMSIFTMFVVVFCMVGVGCLVCGAVTFFGYAKSQSQPKESNIV